MDDQQQTYNNIATAASVAAAAAAVTATSGIMKELSDIKVAQAKNDTEIKNIGISVSEIKVDVKEIKTFYVTHIELDALKKSIDTVDQDHETRLRADNNLIRYGLGALGVIQLAIMIYLALHK